MLLLPLLILAIASIATASKILVPLYSWDENCWPELQQAGAANPSVDFILIINPNSGPISDTNDPSLYCVPILREKLPRATIIGYVRTGYGSRSQADVKADIAMYSSWKNLKVGAEGKAPRLDGIFFDEVQDVTTKPLLSLYSGYSSAARAAFASSTIVMNPGTKVGARLYGYADYIVYFETYYKEWSRSKLPAATYMNKTVIMIHTMPSSNATLRSTLKQFVPQVGATYVTDLSLDKTDVYAAFGPDWPQFVRNVAQLNAATAGSA
ncbi:hypothetical protein JCM10908_000370 [Rhodotorula pacifica]|uniref:spherulation-specific family 4 protein n=1 Tax=Rhodotorula pacifica TaxID=1495444 RepID=UPI00317A07B1